jgi:hypothetical protein
MPGVALGFFTPTMLIKDIGAFCDRVIQRQGITDRGFPLWRGPLRSDGGEITMEFVVIGGALPVHVDKPKDSHRCNPAFNLVMATRNRPFLMTAPADRTISAAILDQTDRKVWSMGCLELYGGLAVHFDPTTHWQGVSSLPLGSTVGEPSAVILRVPWEDPQQIQRAVAIARQMIVADGGFSDLVRK